MINTDNIIEVTDWNMPELDIFARMTDAQLLHCREPEPGLFITESCNVILRALRDGYEPEALMVERRRLEEWSRDPGHPAGRQGQGSRQDIPNSGELSDVLAACGDIPVYTSDVNSLSRLVGYKLTGGILCAMRRRPLPRLREITAGARRIVVLEKVMNPINVGSLFRSAAALHIDALLLTAGSADPLYRRSSRVSMGTVFQIPWTYIDVVPREGENSRETSLYMPLHPRRAPVRPSAEDPGRYIPLLQELGFRTAALALTDRSVSIEDPGLAREERLAIIMGTEGEGLFPETLEDSDYTVKIPMSHGVDSLNVAAAGAVAFWQLTRPV